jgi:hypothetical protein
MPTPILGAYFIVKLLKKSTVFDGLKQDTRKWQNHIIHTVKTYGLKPMLSSATCKFRYDVYVDERPLEDKIGEERYGVGD